MVQSTSIWSYIVGFFSFLAKFFLRADKKTYTVKDLKEPVIMVPEEKMWTKEQLLSPIRHRRYITIYCIADLKDGEVSILDRKGNILAGITPHSRERLNMEGTGRLEDGRVVNVDKFVNGAWNYVVMTSRTPFGMGIRGEALVPWVSLAHHKQQLRTHSLFGRSVIIPSLVGFVPPVREPFEVSGRFEVCDVGGGLRKGPYSKGLWRTGTRKSLYGQFDVFVGSESVYKSLLGKWNSYREVVILPRDTTSVKGLQESLNLLLDSFLNVDGKNGPNTKSAIKNLQDKAGLEETGEWCEDTKRFAEMSLDNWK